MSNGDETGHDPEIDRIRERLAELDQEMFEDEGDLEAEYNELQKHHHELTGDYYELPKDRDV